MSKLEQMRKRIAELAQLQDGWLDGNGLAPTKPALHRADVLALTLASVVNLPYPGIFPSEEGGIQFEWIPQDLEGLELSTQLMPELYVGPDGDVTLYVTDLGPAEVDKTSKEG